MSATVLTIAAAKEAKIEVIENGRGSQALMMSWSLSGPTAEAEAQIPRPRLKLRIPAKNRGAKKVPAARVRVTPHHRSGLVVAWLLVRNRGIIQRKSEECQTSRFAEGAQFRIVAGDVLIAEEIKVATPKTKDFVTFLKSQTEARKVLVISTQFDEITYKAARNIQPVLLNTAAEVNTEQLLAFQKIIVTNEALARLAERLA